MRPGDFPAKCESLFYKTQMETNHNQEKESGIKNTTIIKVFIAIFLAAIFSITAFIYASGSNNKAVARISQLIPFPAAIIDNTRWIEIGELEKNLQALRNFYEKQNFSDSGFRIDFSTNEGQKRLLIKKRDLLEKMIENRVIEILAQKNGIRIDRKEIDRAVSEEIARYDLRDQPEKNLQKIYGWDLEDFKEKIVKPDLYQKALSDYVRKNNPAAVEARKKIEKSLVELEKNEDFAFVARNFSEGESGKNGGELGWFEANQMIPEIAMSVFALEKNSLSDIIESSLGFHIIRVDDKKTENGTEKIKISQILVRTQNFSDWLENQEREMNIFIPLKDFYWDKTRQSVRFKDEAMQKFEENLERNSSGDISVMF